MARTTSAAGGSAAAVREEYYARIGTRNLAPLWEVIHKLVAVEPQPEMGEEPMPMGRSQHRFRCRRRSRAWERRQRSTSRSWGMWLRHFRIQRRPKRSPPARLRSSTDRLRDPAETGHTARHFGARSSVG